MRSKLLPVRTNQPDVLNLQDRPLKDHSCLHTKTTGAVEHNCWAPITLSKAKPQRFLHDDDSSIHGSSFIPHAMLRVAVNLDTSPRNNRAYRRARRSERISSFSSFSWDSFLVHPFQDAVWIDPRISHIAIAHFLALPSGFWAGFHCKLCPPSLTSQVSRIWMEVLKGTTFGKGWRGRKQNKE